jgi:hypothetical protein
VGVGLVLLLLLLVLLVLLVLLLALAAVVTVQARKTTRRTTATPPSTLARTTPMMKLLSRSPSGTNLRGRLCQNSSLSSNMDDERQAFSPETLGLRLL